MVRGSVATRDVTADSAVTFTCEGSMVRGSVATSNGKSRPCVRGFKVSVFGQKTEIRITPMRARVQRQILPPAGGFNHHAHACEGSKET